MATPAVTLITNGGPYAQIANPRLRKAITIYGKLSFCSGAPYNYTNAGVSLGVTEAKLAISDMRAAIGALNPEQIAAARAFMWPRAALGAFAGISTSLSSQSTNAAIVYLASLDTATLELMELWSEYTSNVIVNSLP